MKWLSVLAIALGYCAGRVLGQDGYEVPLGSPGFQFGNSSRAIQFDDHSLVIDGKRTFIMSGEFHPWRLPVPELWTDVLQKMKAGGFNTVSIYVNWGLVEGRRGRLDWNHFRDLELFYQIAQRVGIYVISRPGPYINAETTGGGFPGWLSNIEAVARTNQTAFVEAWQAYVEEFSNITAKYQYPNGTVIAVQAENEFYVSQAMNPTATDAMVILQNSLRTHGIDSVPITCNDVWPAGNFASGEGRADIYGFDSYPGGFDCSNPSEMAELANYYVDAHNAVAPWVFMYLAEFQGGAFDGWQGTGYDNCAKSFGPEWANVFYKGNVAFGATAMSLYMTYGGTNWGNIAYPGVYTSYDYGASIRESRILSPKFSEIKLQSHFYHASPRLLTADVLITAAGTPFTSNNGVFVTSLGGGEASPTNFYILRQKSNNFTSPISTTLNVNTTVGELTIPQFGGKITLDGRESKILVSEYPFGNSTLRYTTGEVLTWSTIDGVDYVILYVPRGQSLEASIVPKSATSPTVTGSSSIKARASNSSIIISGSPRGLSLVRSGSTAVLVCDKDMAKTFWKVGTSYPPTIDLSPASPAVLVAGPYLVRNATISSGSLVLVGDINGTTPLTVFAPRAVKTVTWNGAPVNASLSPLGLGLAGTLAAARASLSLPNLRNLTWKSADSLPEIAPDFDDSSWITANKTSTARPFKPYKGDVILYASEYGFHSGNFIFRGYFSGNATGVELSVQGGNAFGFSAFLNGRLLGSGQGENQADAANATFAFPRGTVVSGKNVLTVVQDSNGLNGDWNSDDEFKEPRGIRGYALIGSGDFDTWKLAGNLGGEDFPDRVRGPVNEGGLWAERMGATLPGFDDAHWPNDQPFTGISRAGIQVYRTKFNLTIPSGIDAPLAFRFTATPSSNYRSVLYVNGWQFGRFISNFGPQTTFPVPEGILNHQGSNEVVLTLWSLDERGARIADVQLVSLGVFGSGKEVVASGSVSSPTFDEVRANTTNVQ